MDVIDRLTVPRRRGKESAATIELLRGDLSAIPPEHAVDALVVSAFPNSYTPNPGTLFEALLRRGLDMQKIAQQKQEDQRERLGCWISRRLSADLARLFNFGRVICFEPRYPAFVVKTSFDSRSIESTVGYVFRCLNNFVIPEATEGHEIRGFDIRRVAMPLLATGNQGVQVEKLVPRLLEAAVFWLKEGLPIECLKIVVFKDAEAQVATRIFAAKASSEPSLPGGSPAALPAKTTGWEADLARIIAGQVIETCTARLRDQLLALASADERPMVQTLFERLVSAQAPLALGESLQPACTDVAIPEYDVFVSYAHKQAQDVLAFCSRDQASVSSLAYLLRPLVHSARRTMAEDDIGGVHKARMFVAVLSPEYSASPVCWDEFQCAKLKEYNTGTSVIQTVRLYSERELPPMYGDIQLRRLCRR